MKSKTLIALAFFALLTSCTNEYEDFNLKQESEHPMKKDARLAEALTRAENLMSRIEGGTRSSARLIESVEYIGGNQLTRGSNADSLYYLINYSNNKGFAVLGATDENEGVYAISPNGHLEMEDTVDNPGLAMFFANLPLNLPTRPGFVIDSTINNKPIIVVDEDLSTQLKPVLSECVRKWHQRYPFNIECNTNGTNYAAGCAPLAVAMIMTYYEWPSSYKSISYDWNAIKSAKWPSEIIDAKIPNLIKEIGAPENLNTSYGSSENGGSGTNVEKTYKRTFEHFGYKKPANFQDFTVGGLGDFLSKNKKPVLMYGVRTGSLGHIWLIDGYYYDWHRSSKVLGEYYGEGYLFHAVWGWGGSSNGYFKISNGFKPMTDYNGSDDDNSYTDQEYNSIQYYNLRFMGDVKPNK